MKITCAFCTRQSRKVLRVVLGSRFLDFSISGKSEKNGTRRNGRMCLQVLKESHKSRFDSYYLSELSRQCFSKQLYIPIDASPFFVMKMIGCGAKRL